MSKPSAADVSDAKYEHLYERRRERERERQWDTTTEIVRQVRAEVIEECAQRVLSWTSHRGYNADVAAELAAAIRALKDKP